MTGQIFSVILCQLLPPSILARHTNASDLSRHGCSPARATGRGDASAESQPNQVVVGRDLALVSDQGDLRSGSDGGLSGTG